jgi:hypothetical protein
MYFLMVDQQYPKHVVLYIFLNISVNKKTSLCVHLLAEIVEKVIILIGIYRHTENNYIKTDKFISNNLNGSFLNKFCRRTQISSNLCMFDVKWALHVLQTVT